MGGKGEGRKGMVGEREGDIERDLRSSDDRNVVVEEFTIGFGRTEYVRMSEGCN